MSKPINIAIIGLGLLGSSLGLALANHPCRRLGWARRPETRELALKNKVVDKTFDDVRDAIAAADLTILALPIPQIIVFLDRYQTNWRPGSVVTDIGSTKTAIMEQGRVLTRHGVHFIGSHPMAGTEKSGLENAVPTLYDNADVFVVPYPDSPEFAIDRVNWLWQQLQTKVHRITPEAHDNLVAHTSHVLHIIASALALSVLDDADPKLRQMRMTGCATGFRDTSRIASSSPLMWREIIESNRPAVIRAMQDFENEYFQYKKLIVNGDFDTFESLFARGKELRDDWINYKSKK